MRRLLNTFKEEKVLELAALSPPLQSDRFFISKTPSLIDRSAPFIFFLWRTCDPNFIFSKIIAVPITYINLRLQVTHHLCHSDNIPVSISSMENTIQPPLPNDKSPRKSTVHNLFCSRFNASKACNFLLNSNFFDQTIGDDLIDDSFISPGC